METTERKFKFDIGEDYLRYTYRDAVTVVHKFDLRHLVIITSFEKIPGYRPNIGQKYFKLEDYDFHMSNSITYSHMFDLNNAIKEAVRFLVYTYSLDEADNFTHKHLVKTRKRDDGTEFPIRSKYTDATLKYLQVSHAFKRLITGKLAYVLKNLPLSEFEVKFLNRLLWLKHKQYSFYANLDYITFMEDIRQTEFLLEDAVKYPLILAARLQCLGDSTDRKNFVNHTWVDCLSKEGRYRNLNITVSNLKVPPPVAGMRMLMHEHASPFPIPLTTQHDIRTFSAYKLFVSNDGNGGIDLENSFLNNIFLYSSKDDVMEVIKGGLPNRLRTNQYIEKMRYIRDAAHAIPIGRRNIKTLHRYAEEYHRDLIRRPNMARYASGRELDQKLDTKKPELALPEDANIKFLSTVGDVYEEGEKMGHCVASYANAAVQGNCYLFHIDFNGEMATAEVSKDGYISQIRGPRNQENKACEYGKKILEDWTNQFKPEINNWVGEIPRFEGRWRRWRDGNALAREILR